MIHVLVTSGILFIVLAIVFEIIVLRAQRKFKKVMTEFFAYSNQVQEDLLNQAKKEMEENGMQMQRKDSGRFDDSVH